MERFSLSQLCIFSSRTFIRYAGCEPVGVYWHKAVALTLGKLECFTSRPTKETCGCWFFLHNSQFLVQSSDISEINTVLQSPYYGLIKIPTPGFIMCAHMDMPLITQRRTGEEMKPTLVLLQENRTEGAWSLGCGPCGVAKSDSDSFTFTPASFMARFSLSQVYVQCWVLQRNMHFELGQQAKTIVLIL